MSSPMTAGDVLNREFLPLRAKLIEIGAMLDRVQRSDGDVGDDPRLATIRAALAVLQSPQAERAERIQLLFSRTYDEHWREALQVVRGGE